MLIHAAADLPGSAKALDQALRDFAALIERHLAPHEGAEVSFAIGETGTRANGLLARSVPDEVKGFDLSWTPSRRPLTAAQFREEIARNRPGKTSSQVRVDAEALGGVSALLDRLAGAMPPTGRGVTLLVVLRGWRIAGLPAGPAVDATLSRFRHGARRVSAGVALRFQALSLKDPVVARTVAEASERLGVRFGKPMASVAAAGADVVPAPAGPDPRLRPPTPEERLVLLASFDEALARTAEQIDARPEDLSRIPLLFGQGEGFDKRLRDVQAGRKEAVSLPASVKRFMRERFPDYRFDAADGEQLCFRKPLAPTLELLVMYDRVHQWGLGKTFSVDVAADLPDTPLGGMNTGWGGTRKNVFWMFHRGWLKHVWAYTTAGELAIALGGCGELLSRVLPALEAQCRRILLPPPTTLPPHLIQRDALSAREAYELIRLQAREWADDVELESVASVDAIGMGGAGAGRAAITERGRLERHGSWGFQFLSRRLDQHCYYVVPRLGRVWWNFHPVLSYGIPKYEATLPSDDWVDSTAVAAPAFQAVQSHLGGMRVHHLSLALRDPKRYSGDFVWEARCVAGSASPSERRDITVHLDRRTGGVLSTTVR